MRREKEKSRFKLQMEKLSRVLEQPKNTLPSHLRRIRMRVRKSQMKRRENRKKVILNKMKMKENVKRSQTQK